MKNKYLKLVFIIFLVLFAITALKSSSAIVDVEIDQEIEDLNLKIKNQKKQIETLQARQKEYQAQIEANRNDQINLNGQLAIIENRLGKTQLDIEETNLEIDKISLEII